MNSQEQRGLAATSATHHKGTSRRAQSDVAKKAFLRTSPARDPSIVCTSYSAYTLFSKS